MNLNDILIFTEVVASGSFTKAADVLGMPKSNVSRNITRLEKSLGVKLIERTTRKLALTEIGRTYYEHSVRMVEEMEAAKAAVEKMSLSPKGVLRVCTSVSVGQNLLSQHLAAFTKTYPEVSLDIRLTNRRVDLLEEGFDVVIRVGDLKDSNLIAKKLCTQHLLLYASPDYLKTTQYPLLNPDDLNRHACLYMNAVTRRAKWTLHSISGADEFEFKPFLSCDNFQVLRQLATDGAGIALLPDYLCTDYVSDGRLIPVLEDWVGGEVDFYTLVPSRRGITPKVRAFLDHLHERCMSNPNLL
ncbi:MAG: LysR family transcriptional regulator [Robiginitomaculum sp.]|nr:MAG: LysR family transcriptional regulator [Robiginitomaculum sp.]